MNARISGLLAVAGVVVAGLLGSAQSRAQNAYTSNSPNNVLVIAGRCTSKRYKPKSVINAKAKSP